MRTDRRMDKHYEADLRDIANARNKNANLSRKHYPAFSSFHHNNTSIYTRSTNCKYTRWNDDSTSSCQTERKEMSPRTAYRTQ
jgi:hypothetical protein